MTIYDLWFLWYDCGEMICPRITRIGANEKMEYQTYLNLLPKVKESPQQTMWVSYDAEADALYVNFKKPSQATDSELTEDDVIVRYEGQQVIGYTVLHASRR